MKREAKIAFTTSLVYAIPNEMDANEDKHSSLEQQYNSPGQQTPVCLNVEIFIVDHAKVCQMSDISPPHNTMRYSTSKHFAKGHRMLPVNAATKWTMALWPTGKHCLSCRGFRNAQQDCDVECGVITPL